MNSSFFLSSQPYWGKTDLLTNWKKLRKMKILPHFIENLNFGHKELHGLLRKFKFNGMIHNKLETVQ
jgi:hypothetical protein